VAGTKPEHESVDGRDEPEMTYRAIAIYHTGNVVEMSLSTDKRQKLL
jgi:hypothetical protein